VNLLSLARKKLMYELCCADRGVLATTRPSCAREILRPAAAAAAISGSGLYAALFESNGLRPMVRTSVAKALKASNEGLR
jgi:hypothetical protein